MAGLDRIGVANHLFVTGAAFLVGILSSGAIADWFVRRAPTSCPSWSGFLALFLLSQVGIVLEVTDWNLLFWIPFGMSGQVAVLAYPWLSARFGTALSGRANTAMNLLLFLAAFAIQYAIGAIIALYPDDGGGGIRPQVLPGGVRAVPRAGDRDLRAVHRELATVSGAARKAERWQAEAACAEGPASC